MVWVMFGMFGLLFFVSIFILVWNFFCMVCMWIWLLFVYLRMLLFSFEIRVVSCERFSGV